MRPWSRRCAPRQHRTTRTSTSASKRPRLSATSHRGRPMKIRALIAVFVLTAGEAALAQPQTLLRKTIRSTHKFTLAPGGTFVLENPIGNVDVRGSDVTDVQADVVTILTAENQAALDQASKSGIIIGTDPKTRVLRTAIGAHMPRKGWSGEAHWTVKVPRNASVRILST